MAAPLSIDLRRRVFEAYQAGDGGYKKIAHRFSLNWNTVRRWVHLAKTTGSLSPRPNVPGRRPKIPPSQWPALKELVAEKPDRTLPELASEWSKRHNVELRRSCISKALIRAGITTKKNFQGQRTRS